MFYAILYRVMEAEFNVSCLISVLLLVLVPGARANSSDCASQADPVPAANHLRQQIAKVAAPLLQGIVQVSPDNGPEVADPALSIQPDGTVVVSGTGGGYVWPSMEALLSGQTPQRISYRFLEQTPNGLVELTPGELPWDIEELRGDDGKRELIAGFMSPPSGKDHASWPEDNISRRLKRAVYDPTQKAWIVDSKPIFGTVSHTDWNGHSYGHDIVQTSDGRKFIYYERVSGQVDGSTGKKKSGGMNKTEIFAREIGASGKFGPEEKMVGIDQLPLEDTRRAPELGGFLLEGPRVKEYSITGGAKAEKIYVMWANGKDFPTKNYPTYAFVSKSPSGPFEPYQENGKIVNFSAKIQDSMKLHGVGRAFPFVYQGQQYIIFHGAKDQPGQDYTDWPKSLDGFRRDLFVAPISVSKRGDGSVQIAVTVQAGPRL